MQTGEEGAGGDDVWLHLCWTPHTTVRTAEGPTACASVEHHCPASTWGLSTLSKCVPNYPRGWTAGLGEHCKGIKEEAVVTADSEMATKEVP